MRLSTCHRVLYVRNLPFNISSEEMYDIFGKYGALRQVRVGDSKETRGTAFVVYEVPLLPPLVAYSASFSGSRCRPGAWGRSVTSRLQQLPMVLVTADCENYGLACRVLVCDCSNLFKVCVPESVVLCDCRISMMQRQQLSISRDSTSLTDISSCSTTTRRE